PMTLVRWLIVGAERAFRTMRADVTILIDILLDTDLQPVFTVDDNEQVEAICQRSRQPVRCDRQ
ncbi:phage tail assembly chaperone, partial [Klebsiella pneumoniae]|uniref:phage tail assembly chaperone n=1 Tax=Klebsiella pneumoniae TaxID=573 RepID=UPI002731401C